MKKLVITGSTGHIGLALLNMLPCNVYNVHAICRKIPGSGIINKLTAQVTWHAIDDLADCDMPNLANIMDGADVVIHLAAKIYESEPPQNCSTVRMSCNISDAAQQAKVPKIIVLSSIYARLAEQQADNARLYGHQKLAAELCFKNLGSDHDVVILRPPAVYGAGMGGPLKALINITGRGMPLPFGNLHNRRDYIAIDNLLNLLMHLINHQTVGDNFGETRIYEPCDGYPVSTKTLVQMIANVKKANLILIPVPRMLITMAGRIFGKAELVDGAISELIASGNASLLSDYGWNPVVSMPASLDFILAD